MLDTRPNHTIYINNLNEKIKKEGMFLLSLNNEYFTYLFLTFMTISCRLKEISVCDIFPIWTNS